MGFFVAMMVFSGLILFAPNPDIDGDGKGEVLRVEQSGISVDSVQQ